MPQNVVSADQWNFVQGTLSAEGPTINWSNGTYWTRCSGGGGHRIPNRDETWYRGEDRAQPCTIRQRKRNLQLRNESGKSASGTVDRRGHDDLLVGNADWRNAQPRWQHDLLGTTARMGEQTHFDIAAFAGTIVESGSAREQRHRSLYWRAA